MMTNSSTPEVAKDVDLIDWLISLRSEYRESPLSRWEGRYESTFLKKFAELANEYPRLFLVATDYLFAASSYMHVEELSRITRDNVQGQTLDRRASMQGGFPWTDYENPWPTEEMDDGTVRHARPFLQLNLRDIGSSIGINLPAVLFQVWEHGFGERTIDLADIDGTEPCWDFPDIDTQFSDFHYTPFGWSYIVDRNSPEWHWVGNLIDIEQSGDFMLPDMSWCLGSTWEPLPPWADVESWIINTQQGDWNQAAAFAKRLSPPLKPEQLRDIEERQNELLALNEIEKEKLSKLREIGKIGAFQGDPVNVVGSNEYYKSMLAGTRMLYEPVQRNDYAKPGLDFYDGDGSFFVDIYDPHGALGFDETKNEVEFGVHIGFVEE